MMAKKPAERPASMTELISLLEACRADARAKAPGGEAPKSKPELMVFNEATLKRPALPRTDRDPAIFPRPTEAEGLAIDQDLNLEDLIMDVRSDPRPEPLPRSTKPMTSRSQPLKRPGKPTHVSRTPRTSGLIAAIASIAALIVGVTWFIMTRGVGPTKELNGNGGTVQTDPPDPGTNDQTGRSPDEPAKPFQDEFHTIFDGSSAAGWILSRDKSPLPRSAVQKDGLNPLQARSYLVVYHEKLSDFELDFDYKFEKGCNTGIFLRVSDLADPINTGIEVQIHDSTGHGLDDPGGFFDLVAPQTNAQNPAGQSNHMTVTAQGPEISVVLNGTRVSTIDLDEWTAPGKRPDGSDHKFKNVAIANLARIGYVGFQGVNGNCWFNNVRLRKLSPSGVSSPGTVVKKDTRRPTIAPAPAAEPYVETGRFVGHAQWVQSVQAFPDRKRLLSTSYDKTARLWDIPTGREIRRFWHPDVVLTASILPDGRRAITGCSDGSVRLWDLESGRLIRPLVRHGGIVRAVALSPDGTHALSGGDDKTLRILDVEKGGEFRQFEGISARISSIATSSDGRRVIAGGEGGVVYLGNTNTSDPVQLLPGHSDWVWTIAFAPDGRHAVSGAGDGRLIYWDLDHKRALRQAKLDDIHIAYLAFEADGHHVIFGAHKGAEMTQSTGVLGRWDIASDAPSQTLAAGRPHTGLALLSSDAIATADHDGVMRVWEPSAAIAKARQLAKTGKLAGALPEYDKAVANRPSDPRLLIERGRLLATLGQAEKAAADFENAANLAPESPQFFLDAPWWVAGPYPPDYSQAGALENATATDPSQPAPPLGNTTIRWHDIAPHQQGSVNFEELFKTEGVVVAYAMTVVYSARPREAVLLIGTDDTARIWLNGREVFLSKSSSAPDSNAILVTLHSGRNTFVAKVQDLVKGGHSFSVRFGESPADLARAYARAGKPKEVSEFFTKAMALDPDNFDRATLEQLGESMAQAERWKEAKTAFEKIYSLDPGNFGKQHALAKIYLALGEQQAYERLCTAAIARHGKTQDPKLANDLIWLAALMPNALRSYAEVVDIGSKLVKGRNPDPNSFNTFGAVLFRAGLYPSSLSYLKRSIDAKKGEGTAWDWVFRAMALHKARQPGDRDALARAKAIVEKFPPSWWQQRVELKALLNEAEEMLNTPSPR